MIFAANLVPAGYLGYVHQQGTLKVMDKLADVAQNYKSVEGVAPKVFFMMPCHSTPYYSHIHANISMRFLTCEPNFNNEPKYLDEADQFYDAPMSWIRKNLPVHPISALPTHLVVFDTLAPRISDFLSIYKPVEVFFHSEHLVSTRGGKNVILYERVETKPPKQQAKPPTNTNDELWRAKTAFTDKIRDPIAVCNIFEEFRIEKSLPAPDMDRSCCQVNP